MSKYGVGPLSAYCLAFLSYLLFSSVDDIKTKYLQTSVSATVKDFSCLDGGGGGWEKRFPSVRGSRGFGEHENAIVYFKESRDILRLI